MAFNQFMQAHFKPDKSSDLTEQVLISLFDNPHVFFNTQSIKLQDDLVDQLSGVDSSLDNQQRWQQQIAEDELLVNKLREQGFNALADHEQQQIDRMKNE